MGDLKSLKQDLYERIEWNNDDMDVDDAITDALLVVKAVDMKTGKVTCYFASSLDIDMVTRAGLLKNLNDWDIATANWSMTSPGEEED